MITKIMKQFTLGPSWILHAGGKSIVVHMAASMQCVAMYHTYKPYKHFDLQQCPWDWLDHVAFQCLVKRHSHQHAIASEKQLHSP